MELSAYPNGVFCWIDLAATDTATARAFYGSVLGWDLKDSPVPGGSPLWLCLANGRETAALYQISDHRAGKGD
jgi:uncharacterized protein